MGSKCEIILAAADDADDNDAVTDQLAAAAFGVSGAADMALPPMTTSRSRP